MRYATERADQAARAVGRAEAAATDGDVEEALSAATEAVQAAEQEGLTTCRTT